ncbi:hypothetical protein J1614_004389 [Plenodomus biglobosus]|nr:hypothetical protein J1614_004389 [Plenodomus biglobosus]
MQPGCRGPAGLLSWALCALSIAMLDVWQGSSSLGGEARIATPREWAYRRIVRHGKRTIKISASPAAAAAAAYAAPRPLWEIRFAWSADPQLHLAAASGWVLTLNT